MNPISINPSCTINLSDIPTDQAWDIAKDVVTYPVSVEPLYFETQEPVADGAVHLSKMTMVESMSTKGTIGLVFGVFADRDRIGKMYLINTVSTRYALKLTADVYEELQKQLNSLNIVHKLNSVYVSANGGQQQLVVNLSELQFKSTSSGEYNLAFHVTTSIDGTKAHQLDLIVVDKNGRPLYGVESISLNFFTKHTSKMQDRLTAFDIVIEGAVSNWNETILPLLVLMDTPESNRNIVLDAIKGMLEDGGIPERHIESYLQTLPSFENFSMLSAMNHMSQYFEQNMEDRPERKQALREKFNKASSKVLARLYNR